MDTETLMLTKEEADEILKICRDKHAVLPTVQEGTSAVTDAKNTNALNNINKLKSIIWKEALFSFLQRKSLIKSKPSTFISKGNIISAKGNCSVRLTSAKEQEKEVTK